MDAWEAARRLIQPYVERGDTIESLKRSCLGHISPGGYDASIGGYMPVGKKHWSGEWILVHRDTKGKGVAVAFKLQDIYDACKYGQSVLDQVLLYILLLILV